MPHSRISVAPGSAAAAGTMVAEYKSETVGAGGSFTTPTTNNSNYEAQSTGGAVTTSNTPFGAVAPPDNAEITITGLSDVNTFTIPFADVDYGCLLDGDFLGKRGTSLSLKYIPTLKRYVPQGAPSQLLV